MISAALVKYVLTAAVRDRLLMAVLGIVVLGLCLSLFSASSAIVEKGQFAVVYTASSLRFLVLAGLVLFVVFFVRRSFDARDIEYLLSRPVSRTTLILSNSVAFSILALGAGGVLAAVMALIAINSGQPEGLMLWLAGVTCEYVIVVNVAFFFSMVLTSPTAAGLGVVGFYALGRLMGDLLGIVHSPTLFFPGLEIVNGAMKMVSMIIPRLDLMTQTSWLIYGVNDLQNYGLILLQTFVFLCLTLVAALVDLLRRQF